MTRKEFLLGISIIVLFVIFSTMLGCLTITTIKEIKIKKIYHVDAITDESGNVEVSINEN